MKYYMIRNKNNDKFSTGGAPPNEFPWPSASPKMYTRLSDVKGIATLTKNDTPKSLKDWEVVEVEIRELESYDLSELC